MAVPTISNTTSVLGFARGDLVNYQPYASDSPTSWAATGLPSGLSINGTTGLISGTAEPPGVFVVGLTATNGTGTSAVHEIAIGIGQGDFEGDGLGVDLDIDLATGTVALAGLQPGGDEAPTLFVKSGDQLLLDVGFWKGGYLQQLPITAISMNLREFEGDGDLTLSDGSFDQISSDRDTRFRIMVDFNKAAIEAALSSYESDVRTGFLAIAEIEWQYSHGDPVLSPSTAIRTSQTFRVVMDRDMI